MPFYSFESTVLRNLRFCRRVLADGASSVTYGLLDIMRLLAHHAGCVNLAPETCVANIAQSYN